MAHDPWLDGWLGALMQGVWETTLASSAAIVLVLALRRPLRRRFGAVSAYLLWTAVPAAMLAVLLPATSVVVPAPQPMPAIATVVSAVPALTTAAAIDPVVPMALLWLCGGLALAMLLGHQQRRFVRALGELQPLRPEGWRAQANAGLPAAIGVLRPRIVLPSDFDTRYAADEQVLIRAHERTHIRSGDLAFNAVLAALRCLYWFNPLLHYAARCFRHDQELACDQRVMARHPQSRRAYGEAMLKTHLAAQSLPLGCHWGYGHPLKERIEMIRQPVPGALRWFGGATIAMTLVLGGGVAAWSAQPQRVVPGARVAPEGTVQARISMQVDGSPAQTSTVLARIGEPFSVRTDSHGSRWEMQAKATPRGDGSIRFESSLMRDGKVVATPQLVVRDGQNAAIRIGQRGDGEGASADLALEVLLSTDAILPPVASAPLPPQPPIAPTPLPNTPALVALPVPPPAPLVSTVPPMPAAPIAPPVPPASPAPTAPPVPAAPSAPPSPDGALVRGVSRHGVTKPVEVAVDTVVDARVEPAVDARALVAPVVVVTPRPAVAPARPLTSTHATPATAPQPAVGEVRRQVVQREVVRTVDAQPAERVVVQRPVGR
ncbi:M56 family metallopeptidase [Montanilutibacter psychrotolerans]|uniref:Peptidase M56 domain-containing protein n=1 Tax=Montanilutibacter psychrotolerans TaxID=1327343 RepID=A0A3M8SX86_9GAMM|nr:M56 family metallopeptidase [Lysobacter psychrotolerans]RNF85919.1 hypothetical protein EER27_00285 [Lysobacter psychrotolerans]